MADSEKLKRLNYELQLQLQDSENKMMTAARYGQDLLKENKGLKTQLNELENDLKKRHETQLEHLEQEKHSLKGLVESLQNENRTFKEEFEFVSSEHKKSLREYGEAQDKLLKYATAISNLKQEVKLLTNQLAETKKQVLDLNEQLAAMQKKEESSTLQDQNNTNSQQVADLWENIQKLEMERVELLNDAEVKEKLIKDQQEDLVKRTRETDTLRLELEESECQANVFANTLETCRREMAELKTSIDSQMTGNVDINQRGNSLFSEVEDRRQKCERYLKGLKERYRSECKRNEEYRKTIYTLKLQLSDLVMDLSRKVDSSYAKQLEYDLEQAQDEIKQLHSKNEALKQISRTNKNSACPCSGILKEGVVYGSYESLKVMLNQARSQITELEKECEATWMQYAAQRDEATRYRKMVRATEAQLECMKAEKIKMAMENEDLQRRCKDQSDHLRVEQMTESPLKTEQTREPKTGQEKLPPKDPLGSWNAENTPNLQQPKTTLEENRKSSSSVTRKAPTNTVKVTYHKNDCKQQ